MSVALLTALAGYARTLTPEEALARVNATDAPARVASMTRDGGISLVHTEMSRAGVAAAYIFSRPDAGYMIVSADDAATPLLGYGENATAEVKQGYYKEVKALTDEFKAEFSELRCPALMARLNGGEYNLPDDEDYKARPCLIFVEKAVEILEKKLERQGK